LRTCKSKVGGYAYASDRLQTFAISHEMYLRANGPVKSYGVFGMTPQGKLADNLFDMNLEYFHVQDFLKGTSLQTEIDGFRFQKTLSESSRERMQAVGKILAELHNRPIPVGTDAADAVRRSQREVFANPQITLDVLAAYPNNHHLLGTETGKYRYLEMMLRSVDIESIFAENTPCVPLHGDFWGSNILIGEQGDPFLIDYSRIPYGDPAVDVGNFLGVLTFDALTYDAVSYFEAAKEFLLSYQKHRSAEDPDILRRCVVIFFWI
jgi:aminoglycoside phosphotransferase (APT) family kinase protein